MITDRLTGIIDADYMNAYSNNAKNQVHPLKSIMVGSNQFSFHIV